MDTFKKVMKVLGILIIIAGAAAGIYLAVTKYLESNKKKPIIKKAADFLSMDSFEDDFISESDFDDEDDEPFLKTTEPAAE